MTLRRRRHVRGGRRRSHNSAIKDTSQCRRESQDFFGIFSFFIFYLVFSFLFRRRERIMAEEEEDEKKTLVAPPR